MAECANKQKCTCSYTDCARWGKCCECVAYHRGHKELPGCFFPSQLEKSGERSIKKFVELNSK